MHKDVLIALRQDPHVILQVLVVLDLHAACQDVVALRLGEETLHPVLCAHVCLDKCLDQLAKMLLKSTALLRVREEDQAIEQLRWFSIVNDLAEGGGSLAGLRKQ